MSTVTGDEVQHEEVITRALRLLNRSGHDGVHYQLLQSGASGSYGYRISAPGGDLVLKVTLPGCPSYVLERAQREVLFYRHIATKVPLGVPRVIDTFLSDDSFVCVLMKAYQPTGYSHQWREAQYVSAARQLAHLHAAFWGRTDQLSELPWLKRNRSLVDADSGPAKEQWRNLRDDEQLGAVLTMRYYEMVGSLFNVLQEVQEALRPFPLTLVHGDCHMANVLHDRRGRLVWADWQEVGIGIGPGDLSFFLERAYFAGAAVPHQAVTQQYQVSLQMAMGHGLPMPLLLETLCRVELLSWLLSWAPYLHLGGPEQLARVLNRIEVLAQRLELVSC
jgi:hypothetical protein